MPKVAELLQQGRREELWQMCCGYTGLTIEQFMSIQRRLMMEQIALLDRCTLGIKIMRGSKPRTVEEFRSQVPLTTYADYLPELGEKREDVLPVKPAQWIRTSGKSGEYSCKWVPMTPAFVREMSRVLHGLGNLSNCRGPGDTSNFPDHPKLIYTVAPRPYTSGAMAVMLEEQAPVYYLPSLEEAERLSFEERIALGFKQALSQGMDFFFGLSLVLVAVGEKFSQSSEKVNILPLLRQPSALFRLARGLVRSKLAHRALLPRDLWTVKGIISSGLDSGVYREKIKELWGRYPLDVYAGTEGGIIATQTWDYDTMTFIPDLNFLEFIPENEYFKWQLDRSYQPKTVLLDEVKAGENYEIVISNFHGGAMIRYRPGDMVQITALRNEKAGIELPQMVFVGRADDLLDFGVTRLTEKTIWQAIQSTGIPYEDWVASKEVGDKMVLHLFIECKDGCQASEADVKTAVSKQLTNLDSSFVATHSDVGSYLEFDLKVTLLSKGAFAHYIAQRRAEGAELAHLKPPHVNPPEKAMSLLLTQSRQVKAETTSEEVAIH